MNYIVKSAGNGVSQKNITIDITAKEHALTIQGEVLCYDREYGQPEYDVADWEIVSCNGNTDCNHTAIWNSLRNLYGEDFTTTFAADIDAALIEVAGEMVAKREESTPVVPTIDRSLSTMEERVKCIDWEAVSHAFEAEYDFMHGMQEALDDADINDNTEVSIRTSYGREFTVETEVDTYQIARSMAETMASNVYEFCEEMTTRTAKVTAA